MALAERTLELVNIPSESRDEQAIYAHLRQIVTLEKAYDDGESLIFARREGKPLVLLAGHTDTVPAQGNLPGRVEDGAVIGLGASDMKGGLAVMVELARWAETADLSHDVGFLFFPREEVGPEENPLPGVFERSGLIDDARLVVCLEPTDNTLQLGCLGNLNARVVFEGRSAHSARPWAGVNAIELALRGLEPVLAAEPHDVEIAGLVFREVMTVTELHAGIASNVVPGRAEATVNFRYAPNRTPESAEAHIRAVLGDGIEISSHAPPAHVPLEAPLVDLLRAAGDFDVQPKQAWTNVADFAARGLDAVNLGPGATRYAHAADERVAVSELERTFAALQAFLAGTV
jgi:succinyl-diaminopimelate desuccinylase